MRHGEGVAERGRDCARYIYVRARSVPYSARSLGSCTCINTRTLLALLSHYDAVSSVVLGPTRARIHRVVIIMIIWAGCMCVVRHVRVYVRTESFCLLHSSRPTLLPYTSFANPPAPRVFQSKLSYVACRFIVNVHVRVCVCGCIFYNIKCKKVWGKRTRIQRLRWRRRGNRLLMCFYLPSTEYLRRSR